MNKHPRSLVALGAAILVLGLALPACTAAKALGPSGEEAVPAEATAPMAQDVNTSASPATAVEMSLARLQQEFAANPEATAAKYAGQRLLFRGVVAEVVSSIYKPMEGDLYVTNGDIKFRPLYPSYLTPLKINSVMDIEGTVEYVQFGFLIVRGCTFTVTDTTDAIDRPDYIFTF